MPPSRFRAPLRKGAYALSAQLVIRFIETNNSQLLAGSEKALFGFICLLKYSLAFRRVLSGLSSLLGKRHGRFGIRLLSLQRLLFLCLDTFSPTMMTILLIRKTFIRWSYFLTIDIHSLFLGGAYLAPNNTTAPRSNFFFRSEAGAQNRRDISVLAFLFSACLGFRCRRLHSRRYMVQPSHWNHARLG